MRLSRKSRFALRVLERKGRAYGLEIVKESEGLLRRGTVYVLLGRLADRGLIASEQEIEEGRPGIPLRYYFLTALGAAALKGLDDGE